MTRLIENKYPSRFIDPIAEKESYRKEVYRPVYHTHKWWAQRLGSVFRAIIIGAVGDNDVEYEDEFYKTHSPSDKVIFDPFMGSGTTIGEAIKLGVKAIGCDVNPVSSFIVKQSLQNIKKEDLITEFLNIERKVKHKILQYYKRPHPKTGSECTVLYYFWVKTVSTPDGNEIPLFSNYIFSKNAYPKKKPEVKIICPNCFNVLNGLYNDVSTTCTDCQHTFNPQIGPVKGAKVKDEKTGKEYRIIDLIQRTEQHPNHKLYASMVLLGNGKKEYLRIDDLDIELYDKAKRELEKLNSTIPNMNIIPGHNTNQAIKYNYKNWRNFFNSRQLLTLNILLSAILEIKNTEIREQFLTLFSGTLEFNNMFCSFKGEGTGAVRHIFNNHILKPERIPLENCVWGTEKSSGTFSTLFKSRLLKSKEYLDNPFELQIYKNQSKKVYSNKKINPAFCTSYDELISISNSCLILNGDSSKTNIPSKSIDAVVTDPPYFDFVHYSELSDFFYAWLKPNLKKSYRFFEEESSRRKGEVQSKSEDTFANNLSSVFKESNRVLKDDGVLVFSFHHSTSKGWAAIFKAIHNSGFYIVKSHIVKAEMSVASPKSQAKSPINLDALIVCKKSDNINPISLNGYIQETLSCSKEIINDFENNSRYLSQNDKKVIFYSQLIQILSRANEKEQDSLYQLIRNTEYIDVKSEPSDNNKKNQESNIIELTFQF